MNKLLTYIQHVLKHILIWTLAFALYNFFREYCQEIKRPDEYPEMEFFNRVIFQIIVGIISGIVFGTYQYFFNKVLANRFSFGITVAIGSMGYAVVILIFILMAFSAYGLIFQVDIGKANVEQFFATGNATVLIFYCFLVGFFIDFIQQIDKKFGPGNLGKMLSGKFYSPKEEERIFMFLDMKSSTSIAEKLGHIEYSKLIQDCFQDIRAVIPFQAEIYQYVGDEVVLTWQKDNGLSEANCINAFFAFEDQLKKRENHYLDKYGLLPEFKAGIHGGMVIVAEVGEIKREIAYHGDTINTAARIQSMCNTYKAKLLASKQLLNSLQSSDFSFKSVGEVMLRGKEKSTLIYTVEV